jgi:hypothetical protein
MDYKITRNAILFDELLAVLNKHQNEPGAIETLSNLKAARTNYVQRGMDHMLNCLLLVIHELVEHPPSQALQTDLRAVIHRHVTEIFQAGAKLTEMAHEYEASGGKLLSHDEIMEEVNDRRGASR